MAILSDKVPPGFEQQPGEGFMEHIERTGKLVEQMQAAADALPEGEYKGAILSFPVADGSALYLVEKLKPLTLQHIPYLDGYQIPAAHVKGLDLDDVADQVRRARGWRALFKHQSAGK